MALVRSNLVNMDYHICHKSFVTSLPCMIFTMCSKLCITSIYRMIDAFGVLFIEVNDNEEDMINCSVLMQLRISPLPTLTSYAITRLPFCISVERGVELVECDALCLVRICCDCYFCSSKE